METGKKEEEGVDGEKVMEEEVLLGGADVKESGG